MVRTDKGRIGAARCRRVRLKGLERKGMSVRVGRIPLGLSVWISPEGYEQSAWAGWVGSVCMACVVAERLGLSVRIGLAWQRLSNWLVLTRLGQVRIVCAEWTG